jgi:hypothetical protein
MQFTIKLMKHDLVVEIKAINLCSATDLGDGLSESLTDLVLSVGVISNL